MIAWSVLTHPHTGTPVLAGCGLTDTRADAVADLTDAIRGALMDAAANTPYGADAPRYTALVDAEHALTLTLTRTPLGRLDLEKALDDLEAFEATENAGTPAAAVTRLRESNQATEL